jgi:signal transduction histidine kinase/CheY-like chemotaxis protein
MSRKNGIAGAESVDALHRRVQELERWFQNQDRQIRFLERERQKLSALVNHTDAGFLVFDRDLHVHWMNNVCRGWFGESSGARGATPPACADLLCGARTTCAECPAARSLRAGEASHREMRLEVAGQARHIYATAMPIKTPENRVDEVMLMLQDITDLEVLRRSQDELLRAKEQAESASRAKSEFLANMSHEVRTPMTGILGVTGLLLESAITEEHREYARIIQSSGEALLTIINDVLDFSRIEAGRLAVDPIPFDLMTAVDEVVTLISEKADAKGVELIARYAQDVPRRLVGDAGRIRQVLMNLVGNALKFTHQGHVLINVERLDGDAAQARVRISVEDTGIGIDADKLQYVFEKFTQADGSITRRYGGTGLGLAISKQLVELMGGDLTVTSVAGSGSTFAFALTLPVDASTPIEPPSTDNLAGVRILAVHGHEKVRSVLVEQIESWGARAAAVTSGAGAIAELRAAGAANDPYGIAIVAFDLPDMSLESLAAAVKGDPGTSDTALVMLTPIGAQGDAERLRAAGFDAYVTRPTRTSQLADVISALWGIKRRGVREVFVTRHTVVEARARESAAREAAQARARVLVAEDNAVNRRVAIRLLERLGCRVDVAASGLEVLKKLEADVYDLVFMDCQMPEMDGYEATREIRRREGRGTPRTPIVAMTAHALSGDREKCLEAGMDDFMAKPIRTDMLAEIIDRHVSPVSPDPAATGGET